MVLHLYHTRRFLSQGYRFSNYKLKQKTLPSYIKTAEAKIKEHANQFAILDIDMKIKYLGLIKIHTKTTTRGKMIKKKFFNHKILLFI